MPWLLVLGLLVASGCQSGPSRRCDGERCYLDGGPQAKTAAGAVAADNRLAILTAPVETLAGVGLTVVNAASAVSRLP